MNRDRFLSPLALFAVFALSGPASAGVCDYRLSDLVRSGSSATDKSIAAAEGAVVAAGAAGLAFKAAGLYTIVNPMTGAIMIGSTAAGGSAAGTVGIIAGTSGVLGTIGAIVTAPATITAAAVTAVAGVAFEGGCYFMDDRITDRSEVFAILKDVEKHQDPQYFKLGAVTVDPSWYEPWASPAYSTALYLWNPADQQMDTFLLDDLYIVNGMLMHRDFGLNTELGEITATKFQ
ncbi:hypothetical protein G5B31_07605 [Rhodobacter sp. SGA-6-6]|uniref:hypothetical protein n=1 Tax=Rhodobacter sp. SGA-6-6 TaxID=2710882 RepID=UPI0013EB149E|nr:hypothetical protein [Rhodobacter sp. SGA-6-6]NGM45400.1 hypothetical protein [Rhodobacter sp. SGA-6-6]